MKPKLPDLKRRDMLMHMDKDETYDCYLRKLDQDSTPWERMRSIEIPDDLVARYDKASEEYGEVQDLLGQFYDRMEQQSKLHST